MFKRVCEGLQGIMMVGMCIEIGEGGLEVVGVEVLLFVCLVGKVEFVGQVGCVLCELVILLFFFFQEVGIYVYFFVMVWCVQWCIGLG